MSGEKSRVRETTATAAVGTQCWAMRGVSVIGSRLKSTKLPELYQIVPADSLPRPPPPPSCYVFDAHGDGSSGRAASSALSLGILTLPVSTHLVLQFVCDVVKETGKEVSPFIHIGDPKNRKMASHWHEIRSQVLNFSISEMYRPRLFESLSRYCPHVLSANT